MRISSILIPLLALPALAEAADWWRGSDASLADLMGDGYVVVGFSTVAGSGQAAGGLIHRTLLQNGASLYRCEETQAADGGALGRACYELVPTGGLPLEKVDRLGD